MDAGTALSVFFGAALAVFSIFLVGYSFVRGRGIDSVAAETDLTGSDDPALRDIFDAISTLELEFQLGRLPDEEFQAQFQAYRKQAATVLKTQMEAGEGDPAWLLEQEILLARDAIGETVSSPDCCAAVPNNTANCPHCGAEMVPQP